MHTPGRTVPAFHIERWSEFGLALNLNFSKLIAEVHGVVRLLGTVSLTIAVFLNAGRPLNAQPLAQVAPEVRAELTELMTQLAASADRSTMGGRMGFAGHSPPDVIKLCRVLKFLAVLPADERYEVLKRWMLPSEKGAEPRTAMCYAPLESPPEFFFTDMDLSSHERACSTGDDGVICFSELLVAAAIECGMLEELAVAAKASIQNPHMANTLSVLTAFAGPRDARLDQQAKDIISTWRHTEPGGDRERPKPWPTHMIARAWMRSNNYRQQGEQLAELLADYAAGAGKRELLSTVHRDLATYRVCESSGSLVPETDPGLALWHPGGYHFASGSQVGSWPPWWAEEGEIIAHVSGPEISPLFFDYPLAGEFELAVDGYCDIGSESAVQYGRLVFEPRWRGDRPRMLTIGEREFAAGADGVAELGQFNQLRIRVSRKKVSYLCNGELVYEDENPSPTTPWLALLGRGMRATAWRKPILSGRPEIPRKVSLIHKDCMAGWMSPLFLERVPRQLHSARAAATDLSRYSWYASDGFLFGPRLRSFNEKLMIQSWLAYHRPLRIGDVLSYEFFHQPGEKMVHPTLGRTALILDPEGVRLHWITDIPHMSVGGLAVDNVVTVARQQHGTRPLPLKAGQWNEIIIRLSGDGARVTLNDSDVYMHPLAETDNRMFGFFRYSNRTAAEIRHVVLKGDWPQSLSEQQMVRPAIRSDKTEADESRTSRAALVHEYRGKPVTPEQF